MPDWSKVEKYEPNEITCQCGAFFHSHSMFDLARRTVLTKTPCPQCGKDDNVRRASSPPERFTLGPDDVSRS